ncbi:unnamed protein product, partial [Amoebophrya sp. A25]|eukprot:GSA25T00006647001.1
MTLVLKRIDGFDFSAADYKAAQTMTNRDTNSQGFLEKEFAQHLEQDELGGTAKISENVAASLCSAPPGEYTNE